MSINKKLETPYEKLDRILDETIDNVISDKISLSKGRVISQLTSNRINAAIIQCYFAASNPPAAIGFRNDATLDIPHEEESSEQQQQK